MFNMTDVGQRISVFRKNAGLTQMELANKLGISYQAVSNWERGISMPDISNLSALAEILSVSVDDIINDKKITSILNDQEQDIENISLTPEEFNAVSPLLSCEKNRQLVSNVKNSVNGAIIVSGDEDLNISSLSLTSDEMDAFARRAYESNKAGLLAMLSKTISRETIASLFTDAFDSNNNAAFAILAKRVAQEEREKIFRRAFESGNISMFSILKKYISAEERKKYLEEAISRGDAALSSILISSLKDRDEEDDDEED